jgi:hypothetical protein
MLNLVYKATSNICPHGVTSIYMGPLGDTTITRKQWGKNACNRKTRYLLVVKNLQHNMVKSIAY